MEIITAGDGTAHVSSADDGTIYAGIAGPECYVTGVGEKLSCTMQSANTALIGTGLGIMYGRAFRVATPEEVTIQSGTQNQLRNDIICAHFVTSEDGKESGELVVLKGTPTSGQEAEDPEVPSGDILDGATEAYMPLWRIPLDGINANEPEAMFDVLLSMSELQGEIAEVRDSVSQTPYVDYGVATSTNGLGVAVCTPEPPPWASGRKPDVVLCSLGPTGTSVEAQAKLFTPVLWSIDAPRQFQLRLRREDTHEWATNQAIRITWAAVWIP